MARLFHRTNEDAAKAILSKQGFRDGKWKGAWLSNVPLDRNQGAKGEVLLEIEVDLSTQRLFDEFEVHEIGKPYREFVIPSAVLNGCYRATIVPKLREAQIQESADFWNDYPEGEPARKFAEIEREDREDPLNFPPNL